MTNIQEKEIQQIRETVFFSAGRIIDKVKECLLDTNFTNVPKIIKEKTIWDETIACVSLLGVGQEILYYLVFDYHIDEKIMDKSNIIYKNEGSEIALDMFAQRKYRENLNLELNQELKSNDKSTKKIKV